MIRWKHALGTVGIIGAVVVGVGGVSDLKWGGQAPSAKKPKGGKKIPQVGTAVAKKQTIRSVQMLPGTVEPTRVARLASPAEGPVVEVRVREGDLVQRGQLLGVIGRTRTKRAKLLSDRADLRRLRDEYARVEKLVAKGAVPGEMIDKARVDLARAKAAVAADKELTADFRIRAPWSGVVSHVLVQEGNYVAPRTVLIELFDPASLVVRIALPEAISLKVQRGAEARVRFDALPEAEAGLKGEVTRLYPELDRKLRTRVAEITVDDKSVLAPGMFARVHLTVETVHDALVVAAAAVVTTPQQKQAVFVVEDGVAHVRVIETGIEEGGRVQVVSGLSAGDVVVVSGHRKLKDGARVRLKAKQPKGKQPKDESPKAEPSKAEPPKPKPSKSRPPKAERRPEEAPDGADSSEAAAP